MNSATNIYKGGYGNKDISIITTNNATAVSVFEGFMDFLSLLVHENKKELATNTIILNGASMKDRAITAIKEMNLPEVHLYFDNDKTGYALTRFFQEQLQNSILIDKSTMYWFHKDVNEFLVALCKEQGLSSFHR